MRLIFEITIGIQNSLAVMISIPHTALLKQIHHGHPAY